MKHMINFDLDKGIIDTGVFREKMPREYIRRFAKSMKIDDYEIFFPKYKNWHEFAVPETFLHKSLIAKLPTNIAVYDYLYESDEKLIRKDFDEPFGKMKDFYKTGEIFLSMKPVSF